MATHGGRGGMPTVPKNAKHGRARKRASRSGTAHLEELIAEATVDCRNESYEIIVEQILRGCSGPRARERSTLV
jgi:hypothetical protein